MAEIHRTTMSPGKLELLTNWLPDQPWFSGAAPALGKVGGFRLDDPAGEVGIEIMIVADSAGEEVVHYVVPLSYRDAPLDGADAALIGTSEHGVLGTRWIYDGARDPVVVAQLLALIDGEVVAQDQNVSFRPDPTVITSSNHDPGAKSLAPRAILHPDRGKRLAVTIVRVPSPDGELPSNGGYVQAGWTGPDGATVRAVVAVVAEVVEVAEAP